MSEILFRDYEKVPTITCATRRDNKKRFFTGGVRINLGQYRTEEEDLNYRKKSLRRPLP